MNGRRRGFTMIEIMIVIVVVGVLATMMIFSSTEAESSARAQNIINNFNQISKAVNAWYLDNMHRITTNGNAGQYNIFDTNGKTRLAFKKFVENNSWEILKYLGNNTTIKLTGKEDKKLKAGDYLLIDSNYKYWYVCYDTGTDKGLQSRLAGKAESLGLRGFNDDKITNEVTTSKYYTGGRYVGMSVLDLDK